ncbi:MAG: hypothetical protein QG584_1601 [Pseudomonadota bacterium]|nr:hypothetical protein [Pseudomonadota bacterium]MDQ5945467.1 hypothetical protein [Pseudomonadota bacterium]
MNTPRFSRTLLALVAIASGSAFAQSPSNAAADDFIDRNINQQQRIEQGLQSGQLTTREAARLEKQEGKIENMEARAMRDGSVSQNEARKIDHAQDQVSRNIYQEKHDAQRGNPNSASSQRMQQDVQRNINQQQRIEQGLNSGQLTQREAGRLEHREAQANRMQGRAGADGHVGSHEQQRIQHAQNRQSNNIWRQKHDGQQQGWGQTNHHRSPQSSGRQQFARR